MGLTHAEFDNLKAKNADLATQVKALTQQLRESKDDAEKLRGVVASQQKALTASDLKVTALKTELDNVPAVVAEATAVPRGARDDEPRYMYRGDQETHDGTLFPDLAAFQAADKAEPGIWYDNAADAANAYNERDLPEFGDDEPGDD